MLRLLVILLLLKAIILALLLHFAGVGLSPDEAQYWTWSQQLDWGYYSKPPGIAWQIALTTALFGNTSLGVRVGSFILGILLSLAVYSCAKRSGLSERAAFWSGLVMAFSPLGIYLSSAATTDAGAILFMTAAAAVVMGGLFNKLGPNYLLVGCLIFLGMLYKWTAFLFWPFLSLYLPFFKPLRRWSLLGGIALSLLSLVPSFYWNMHHEWATFRHVGRAVSHAASGNFLEFFGAQIGLIGPIFLALLIASFFYRPKSASLLFAAGYPLVILLYSFMAFFKKMQPNWAAFLYPPSLILIPWVAFTHLKRGIVWLHLGLWTVVVAVLFLFTIPLIQTQCIFPLSYRYNPFRQSVGWENLKTLLLEAGYNPTTDFLFSDKYQTASLLSFYGPEKKRAYFFNLGASRKNQFSFWPQMEEKEVGQTGYFVITENTEEKALKWYEEHYQQRLAPYFRSIEYKGAYPLYTVCGKPVKYVLLFKATEYSGKTPSVLLKY